MSILAKIVRHPTGPFMISLLTTISTALGCGVMPPGQATTRTFTVTGFTLPVAMAYAGKPEVSTKVHGIAANEVFDVLERQGRSAFLPDAVISTILGQLNVTIAYRPLGCNMAVSPDETLMMRDSPSCVIVSNTVTGICTANNKKCSEVDPANVMLMPVPSTALTIGGTLSTTNIIMANWSRTMWQSVVNRAVRMLASRPFGQHFFAASAVVSGN
ncbi:hypothetical protein KIN20_008156 [Parelaphostrongylus tenuis]|uniref:Secreted protein n=1 Tax=Parelaphostrongylus tenuis TaxID=148309 RepID=A0AAD5M4E1_PARTN|nr:hypothetical protein KIN20_008156 [Parelaphostrongylus tenuis]